MKNPEKLEEQLKVACKIGHKEWVKELLNNPALNPAIDENEALNLAVEAGYPEIIQLLLSDPRVSVGPLEYCHLLIACEKNDITKVKEVLSKSKIDARYRDSYAIYDALLCKKNELVAVLFKNTLAKSQENFIAAIGEMFAEYYLSLDKIIQYYKNHGQFVLGIQDHSDIYVSIIAAYLQKTGNGYKADECIVSLYPDIKFSDENKMQIIKACILANKAAVADQGFLKHYQNNALTNEFVIKIFHDITQIVDVKPACLAMLDKIASCHPYLSKELLKIRWETSCKTSAICNIDFTNYNIKLLEYIKLDEEAYFSQPILTERVENILLMPKHLSLEEKLEYLEERFKILEKLPADCELKDHLPLNVYKTVLEKHEIREDKLKHFLNKFPFLVMIPNLIDSWLENAVINLSYDNKIQILESQLRALEIAPERWVRIINLIPYSFNCEELEKIFLKYKLSVNILDMFVRDNTTLSSEQKFYLAKLRIYIHSKERVYIDPNYIIYLYSLTESQSAKLFLSVLLNQHETPFLVDLYKHIRPRVEKLIDKHMKLGQKLDSNYTDINDYSYPIGPLPKTKETKLFECLTKAILNKEAIHIENTGLDILVSFNSSADEKPTTFTTTSLNLGEIIDNLDITHLLFEESYQIKYLEFVLQRSLVKPVFEDALNTLPTHLKDLPLAHKIVINIYTAYYYKWINGLLRKNFTYNSFICSEQLLQAIVHTAMFGNALHALAPYRNIEDRLFRMMKIKPLGMLNQYSYHPLSSSKNIHAMFGNNLFIFNDTAAINISYLSSAKHEKEYLLFPGNYEYVEVNDKFVQSMQDGNEEYGKIYMGQTKFNDVTIEKHSTNNRNVSLPRLSCNFAEQNKPHLINLKDLIPVAKHVHDKHLSKEYTDNVSENSNPGWVFDPHEYEINFLPITNRPNHGIVHSARAAVYIPFVIEALCKNPSSSCTIDFSILNNQKLILAIQKTMFYSVVGRENEVSFHERLDIIYKFRKTCGELFEKDFNNIDGPLKSHLTDEEIALIKPHLVAMGDPTNQHPLHIAINCAHKLDLLRCFSKEEYEISTKDYCAQYINIEKFDSLEKLANYLILATGDHLTGISPTIEYRDPIVFTLCSNNINVLFDRIEKALLQLELSLPDDIFIEDVNYNAAFTTENHYQELLSRFKNSLLPQYKCKPLPCYKKYSDTNNAEKVELVETNRFRQFGYFNNL